LNTVLPMHPLTSAEVQVLTAPLTHAQIERAEADIDYARIMADPKLRTSARVFANCVGTLVALGYGYEWLAGVLDCHVEDLFPPVDAPVSTDLMRDALTMAIRIGSRWATPESTGQTEEEIEHAKARALADHRLPPAAYDPLYNYVSGAAPPDGYVTRRQHDARDAVKILALALLVEQDGGSDASIGRRVGTGHKSVGTVRKAVGLETRSLGVGAVLVPGQDRLCALIRRAGTALELGDEHPTEIWTRLLIEAADLHASSVANRRREVAKAA
jgi:hypothetical protein